MKKIDIQELILHILEMDTQRSFISNYQMYLIHNYLLTRDMFSDFGTDAIWRMVREYHEDMQIVEEGIQIMHVEKLYRELDSNLRFSKSDKMKVLVSEVWSSIKDK